MADITLDSITSGYALGKINVNFDRIEEVVNNDILHVRGGNATMHQHLDMNGYRILNADGVFGDGGTGGVDLDELDLRYVNVTGDTMTGHLSVLTPVSGAHPVRLDYLQAALSNLGSGSLTGVGAGANISVNNTNPAVPVVSVTGVLTDITAGTNVTINKTNPAVPVVNVTIPAVYNVRGEANVRGVNYVVTDFFRHLFSEWQVIGIANQIITIPSDSNPASPISTPTNPFMHHVRFLGGDGILNIVAEEGVELILPYMGLPSCSERGMTFTLQKSTTTSNRWHLYGQVDGQTIIIGDNYVNRTDDTWWFTSGSTAFWDAVDGRWEGFDPMLFTVSFRTTTSGANANWRVGYRPQAVRIKINSGPNNGGTLTSFNLDVLDQDQSPLAATTQVNFTGWDQEVTLDIPLTFGANDIWAINAYFPNYGNYGPFVTEISFLE